MRIKKLLIALLSITMVFCFMLAFPVVAESGDSETSTVETIPGDMSGAIYTINFGGASNAPSITGASREKVLEDGEELVMQFTIVSTTLSGNGTSTGFFIGKTGNMPTTAPNNSGGCIYLYSTQNWQAWSCSSGTTDSMITQSNAARITVFSANNEVKVTYKPYQSETELGEAHIYYRKVGATEWISAFDVTNMSQEKAPRNNSIYMMSFATSEWKIKDYSITTTYGANLLTVQEETTGDAFNNKGKYYYGIGTSYAYDGATIAISASTAKYAAEMGDINVYVGAPAVNIAQGEQLVQEFYINEGFDGQPYQFGFAIDLEYSANNPNAYDIWLYNRYSAAPSCTLTGSTVGSSDLYGNNCTNLMKSGNWIKIIYTPYTDSDNLGSLYVYKKSAEDTDYVAMMWAENLGSAAARNNVYLRVYQVYQPAQISRDYTFSNYVQYLKNISSNKETIVFDTREGNGGFYNTDGVNLTESMVSAELSINENKLTFSGATVLNTNVYVKSGDSYKLPTATVAENQIFNGWTANGNTYVAGDVVTVNADTEFVADVTVKSAITYTVLGEDSTVYVVNGDYTLKTVELTDTTFIGWENEGKLYNAGDVVTVSGNMTFTAVTIADFANNGAAISVKDFMGIRFETTFNTEDMAAASAYVVEYGTLIARVGDIGSEDALITSSSTAVKKIVSTMILSDIDGVTTYTGGVSNLQTHNYNVEIAGCGYMVIEYADGDTATIYTDVLVRTAAGIAQHYLDAELYEEGSFEYSVLSAYVNGVAFPTEE